MAKIERKSKENRKEIERKSKETRKKIERKSKENRKKIERKSKGNRKEIERKSKGNHEAQIPKKRVFVGKNRYYVIITFKMLEIEFKFKYTT